MGCSPSANYCFQMGVNVMGFAEHFGHRLVAFGNSECILEFENIYSVCKYVCLCFLIRQRKRMLFGKFFLDLSSTC